LRFCIEESKKLKDGEKWTDPEFGSTKEDPTGANSMYFSLKKEEKSEDAEGNLKEISGDIKNG